MGLFDNTANWQSWLEGMRNVVREGLGIYSDVQGTINPPDIPLQIPEKQPAGGYNPNMSLGDFAFTPNWYLIGLGAVLLLLAFIISRR